MRLIISGIIIVSIISISSKSTYKAPPGTVKVSEELFFDIAEISNLSWKEYVYWQQNTYGKDSPEYKSSLPDTTVWRVTFPNFDAFTEHYYASTLYNSYPVVGVSYEQAVDYCNWRSDRVNELLYIDSHKKEYKEDSVLKNIPVLYKYRLPTKREWEESASSGFSKKVNKKLASGLKNANFKYDGETSTLEDSESDGGDISAPVISYYPNELGIYNMMGNVTEMVQEEGISKGGSWKDNAKDINSKTDISYPGPTSWLGFRCVCEKVK